MKKVTPMDYMVDIQADSTAYKSFFEMRKLRLQHRRHDGAMSAVMDREVFERGNAAAVLVYDDVRDHVLLIEEFRAGCAAAGLKGRACWPLGPIAGMIDQGESPSRAAAREASEEAHVTISEDDLIGPLTVMPSAGGSSEILHLFIATGDLSNVGENGGVDDEHEDIRPVVLDRKEALDAVLGRDGVMVGNTVILLLWLERLRLAGVIGVSKEVD